MEIESLSPKQSDALGEKIAGEYAKKRGMKIFVTNLPQGDGRVEVVYLERIL